MIKKLLLSILAAVCSPAFANVNISEEEITWLIKNIYFEARSQSHAGQMAVMMVTLNRVDSPKFPNTIKEVVTQGGTRRHRCQFSWYCDGKSDKVYNWKAYNEIKVMVEAFLPITHIITDITEGALFYHATYVSPDWASKMKRTVRIDDHIFYK